MRRAKYFIVFLALALPATCLAQVTLHGNVKFGGNVTLRIPPLSLASLSPDSGPVGTTVVIEGISFGGSQGTGTVSFGGVTPAFVQGGSGPCPAAWTNTCIVVVVPPSLPLGNALVQVNVGGVYSNPLSFTVTPAPPSGNQLVLMPSSGPAGTPVTISGINFGTGGGTINFGGVQLSTTDQPPTITSWTTFTILVPVPSGATTGPVTVTVGSTPYTANFTVTPVIAVTSLSPSFGKVGTTVVTISGSNFGTTQGSSTVTFSNGSGGVITATVTSWSATSIVVTVPGGAATGPVVVTVGGYASNPVTFTVTSSNPGTCAG